MCALRSRDGVNEVRLRAAYLPHFVQDGEYRGQAVCRLAISSQGAKLHVQRQADQAFATRDNAHQLGELRALHHHLGCQIEHQGSLIAAHGTTDNLTVLLRLRPDQMRQQKASDQPAFPILAAHR